MFLVHVSSAISFSFTNHTYVFIKTVVQEIDGESEEAKETAELVFNTAALAAGYVLDNAAEYSILVTKMMTKLAQK